ncbi:MAG: cytochrome b/b6 domain-containing protein [Paracoccaceae bacterium]|nr:cytochrome b/b6 domain-containing protein [Paracoccaceae bacterium]
MVRVWDPAVRLFHWALVASFAVAWLTADEIKDLHIWAGYAVAALIAFRLIWGLIGPRYARFSQFVTGPGAMIAYFGRVLRGTEPRYLGHNPAGAAMVVAMLIALSVTSWTGWMMTGTAPQAMQTTGVATQSYAGDDDDGDDEARGGSEVFEGLHEGAANLMLLFVLLHVGGVILASRKTRENLAKSMITGTKRSPEPGDIA